jgi:prophage tail gpP-like protein
MIYVELNNIRYQGFTEVSVIHDIETLCRNFSVKATTLDRDNFPVSRGQACKIYVDDDLILTGYIETISIDYSITDHSITLEGRDRTMDIVDSTLDATMELKTPISLENVIKRVLNYLNITDMKVINHVSGLASFSSSEIVSGKIGQNAFEFLHDFCAKRQVLLTSDESGNIVITRGDGTPVSAALINVLNGTTNNIKHSSTKYDDSKRFNRYIIRSQENACAVNEASEVGYSLTTIAAIKASSTDASIRKSRLLTMNAEKVSDVTDAKNRAQWERDMRRARAIDYSATVFGHRHVGNSGDLWRALQIVNTQDYLAGVEDSLVIRKVEYRVNLQDGNITIISLVPKDTYKLLSEEEKKKKKKDKGFTPTAADIKRVEFGTE